MSDRLQTTQDWNRARALKLHEHFQTVALARENGARLDSEMKRVSRILDKSLLTFSGGEMVLECSAKTLDKEWRYWLRGGRGADARPEWVRRPEALLCNYKPGCGGHRAMPRLLVKELHRRCTLATGGRDKHGRAPVSVAWQSIARDYKLQRPLPGVDYAGVPMGAEIPWHVRTAQRNKPARTVRALGNLGASAHKALGAQINLDYSRLRKCELFTLDDVKIDVVCIDEATGKACKVFLYVFMEVASRLIVDVIIRPSVKTEAKADEVIQQSDVDELLAHGLQTRGFGLGIGYVTHILFERGTVACSDGAKAVLEECTQGRIKVHKTGMVGGVRWIGAAKDKAKGNSAGKAVIESFHRWLHYALLDLPGQTGNTYENQPQNLGDLGGGSFFGKGAQRKMKHTLIDQAEQLCQVERIAAARGERIVLKKPMLYFFQVAQAVREAMQRHNTEPGHDYRGHGEHFEAEVAPGLWRANEIPNEPGETRSEAVGGDAEGKVPTSAPHSRAETLPGTRAGEGFASRATHAPSGLQASDVSRDDPSTHEGPASPREYTLRSEAGGGAIGSREIGIYWSAWAKLAKARPGADRHAITRRVLGANVPHKKLTRPQWAQVLTAFRAAAH